MRYHSPNKGQKGMTSSQNDITTQNHLEESRPSPVDTTRVTKPKRRSFGFVSSRYGNSNGVQKTRRGFTCNIQKKVCVRQTSDIPESDFSLRTFQDQEEKC